MAKRVDGGSIAVIITAWKLSVRAALQHLFLHGRKGERNIAQKNVFINTVRFLFGIKVLKVFTYRQRLNLRKVSTILLIQNSKKVIDLCTQLRRGRGLVLRQSLNVVRNLGTRELLLRRFAGSYIHNLRRGNPDTESLSREMGKNLFVKGVVMVVIGPIKFMFTIRTRTGIIT